MKLYGHPDSGHAFKIRFFMVAAGIEHIYEFVDITKPRDQRQADFQQHARYGEVPVLVDNGKALVQSGAILLYLADAAGKWGAQDADTLQRCREWLMWESNKIGLCLPQLLGHYEFPSMKLNDGAYAWLKARYDHDMGLLDKELSDGRAFIIGDEPTIADFALSGYPIMARESAQASALEVPTHVQGWLSRMTALPGWQTPARLLQDTQS